MKSLENFKFRNVIIGTIAGIVSGLFSTGGGMILVPAFIYLLKIDDTKARGTSVFCILPKVVFFIIKEIILIGKLLYYVQLVERLVDI